MDQNVLHLPLVFHHPSWPLTGTDFLVLYLSGLLIYYHNCSHLYGSDEEVFYKNVCLVKDLLFPVSKKISVMLSLH
jgi:hypothetical protein